MLDWRRLDRDVAWLRLCSQAFLCELEVVAFAGLEDVSGFEWEWCMRIVHLISIQTKATLFN